LTRRVLVTGSRTWTDEGAIGRALAAHWSHDGILVQGECPTGADAIARRLWSGVGGRVESHPADWRRYGKAAGMIRNRRMAEMGADVCLAFCIARSPGTMNMVRLCNAFRIPVVLATREAA
jgi:hypothetical protein